MGKGGDGGRRKWLAEVASQAYAVARAQRRHGLERILLTSFCSLGFCDDDAQEDEDLMAIGLPSSSQVHERLRQKEE